MGHVPPPSTYNNFVFSSLCSRLSANYPNIVQSARSAGQQLAALSISTALVTKLLVIEQLLHPALKFAVSAPWPNFQLCPSWQQILATPLELFLVKYSKNLFVARAVQCSRPLPPTGLILQHLSCFASDDLPYDLNDMELTWLPWRPGAATACQPYASVCVL